MMYGWKPYLFSVILWAFSTGVIQQILSDSRKKALIRYISGITLGIMLLHPLSRVTWEDFLPDAMPDPESAERYVREGEKTASEALKTVIEERCEAYILDKAKALGTDILARITLNEDCLPVFAEVEGNVPGDIQAQLQEILTRDLGIPKENQTWIWSQENSGS